ncbi:hypothetical protein GT360_13415 [Vibrio astriarenae]|uniref:O-antigen ligase-related domain-containing protein n=1 Tax=Vibrio astriarenae TaxID=1481923 RepID=A0A7Z2YEG9_9VIBR|nr:O-antigen ligase family protein [Vibrio astriarenae]QIA64427.1 hypothetical protein GT360_13415 [Vibrio astriarenae]
MMTRSKPNRNNELYYFYFPLAFLLFPTFPRLTSNGDYIVFMFGVGFVLFTFLFLFRSIKVPLKVSAYFLIMLLCLSWSLGLDGYNGIVTFSDISELAKVLCYFVFFLYLYNSRGDPQSILNGFIKLIWVFSLFVVVFNLLDVFNLLGFREVSYYLYKRESVPILGNKAISPFFTTYNFASFMLWPMSFFFLCAFKCRGLSYRIKSLVMFFLVFVTILLSQSRSSLLTIAIALLLMLFLILNVKRMFVVAGGVSLMVFFGIYYIQELKELMPYMFDGIEQISQGNSNSVNYRQDQIDYVFDKINTPLGFGVAKSLYMFESLYSLYPSRYGLFFLVLFLFACVFTSFIYFSVSRRSAFNPVQSCFALSLFVWYITYPISGLSSAHHDTTKFSLFFYGFLGLALYLNQSFKRQESLLSSN